MKPSLLHPLRDFAHNDEEIDSPTITTITTGRSLGFRPAEDPSHKKHAYTDLATSISKKCTKALEKNVAAQLGGSKEGACKVTLAKLFSNPMCFSASEW